MFEFAIHGTSATRARPKWRNTDHPPPPLPALDGAELSRERLHPSPFSFPLPFRRLGSMTIRIIVECRRHRMLDGVVVGVNEREGVELCRI